MASNTYGAIKLSTAEDVGAVLKKKTGSADGYKPKEWAETINLMGLLPVRTASGSIAHFTDGADDVPLKSLTAQILPIQSGTGTPSPSNPRPISGTSVLDIYHSGADTSDYDTTSVALGQEIMGGTADVVGGVGSKNKTAKVLDGTENLFLSGSGEYTTVFALGSAMSVVDQNEQICSHFFFSSQANRVAQSRANTFVQGTSRNLFIQVPNDLATTVEGFKSWLASEYANGTPVTYVAKTTPTNFTFTGQPINSYLGVNNLWTDSGEVLDVEYRADMNLLIAELGG